MTVPPLTILAIDDDPGDLESYGDTWKTSQHLPLPW